MDFMSMQTGSVYMNSLHPCKQSCVFVQTGFYHTWVILHPQGNADRNGHPDAKLGRPGLMDV
jgi:hypothetical protein